MGIEINISNIKGNGDLKVLEDSRISGNTDLMVSMERIEMEGTIELLKKADIEDLKRDLFTEVSQIDKDSIEYQRITELLSTKEKEKFSKQIINYLKEFSSGFLADFLSDWLLHNAS